MPPFREMNRNPRKTDEKRSAKYHKSQKQDFISKVSLKAKAEPWGSLDNRA